MIILEIKVVLHCRLLVSFPCDSVMKTYNIISCYILVEDRYISPILSSITIISYSHLLLPSFTTGAPKYFKSKIVLHCLLVSFPCDSVMKTYNINHITIRILPSPLTIISYYHPLLPYLTIIFYYHLLLSSLTIISYYHLLLPSLTIISYYQLLLYFHLLLFSFVSCRSH
jgi:hypothetical protein